MPDAVEDVTPVFGAIQVPQQTTVVADLAGGYVGYLVIDGVELPTIRLDDFGSQDVEPGEQVEFPPGARFEPGNATLTFTPGEDQDIESFDAGLAHGAGRVLEGARGRGHRPLLQLDFTVV